MSKFQLEAVVKTLIIRDEGIGDVILTTPAIRALRNATGAKISYATNRNYKILLECNPDVDEIFDISQLTVKMKQSFSDVIDLRFCSEHHKQRHEIHRIHTYVERTGVPIPKGEEHTTLNLPDRTLVRGKELIQWNKKKK